MSIDPQKLALIGISFGGYFVTRAAAHEPRIKALLIADSPIVDFKSYIVAFQNSDPDDLPPQKILRAIIFLISQMI
ncbi:alpha/beta hydrolase family protein [Coxiella-like endosymbiont]|uniref:alpha/beta hydrolase family protein n=1 Tax=Coxiella-like endosymbiont TaxID=1592897 RepID=UPI0034E2ADDE